MYPVHRILYFCCDQIKSGMGRACGKYGRRKGAQRVLTGQPDRQRIVHRNLERLADMTKVFTEHYYNLMQLLCAFVGLKCSKKQNCYDLDGFIRSEYVTDFIT